MAQQTFDPFANVGYGKFAQLYVGGEQPKLELADSVAEFVYFLSPKKPFILF
jgi:hypothetical protein